jgi:hypothetical protein
MSARVPLSPERSVVDRRRPAQLVRLLLLGIAAIAFRPFDVSLSFLWSKRADGPKHISDLQAGLASSRRGILLGLPGVAAFQAAPAFAKESYRDDANGYEFNYPTGLQQSKNPEYSVFFRDIIEVLDSIGVQTAETDRKDLSEIGKPEDVAAKLISVNVPKQAPREIIKVTSKTDKEGRRRDYVEYVYQWQFSKDMAQNLGRTKFQLHNYAMVCLDEKRQYIVIATAEDRRWPIIGDELKETVDKFRFLTEPTQGQGALFG